MATFLRSWGGVLAWSFLAILPAGGLRADDEVRNTALRTVSPEAAEEIALGDQIKLVRIGEGAYVVRDLSIFMCNSVLVEMADGTLVMAGTPCTAEAMEKVLAWAKEHFGERKIVGIDTGYHLDNLGGNKALLDAGCAVYGSDLTVQLLAEKGEWMRELTLSFMSDKNSERYRAVQEQRYYPPDHVFEAEKGLSLFYGGEEVRAIYPGPMQAKDKIVVYFPSRKLLFGSCSVLAGERLGNMAEADRENWPKAIRSLMALPVNVVVPGHGLRLDPGLLQHTVDLLEKK
jgi:metallo-beta-lactamase class B